MTFTHLRVGTSNLPAKPPRAQPPCLEPYVTGTNILKDPGLELHIANNGRAGEIPIGTPASSKQHPKWVDGSLDAAASSGWWLSDGGPSTDWIVTDTDPRSGTYHVESVAVVVDGAPAIVDPFAQVNPTNLHTCQATTYFASSFIPTARVEPGDFVQFSYWAKQTDNTGVLTTQMVFYTSDIFGVSSPQLGSVLEWDSATLTTSYTQITEVSAFAPATAYWVKLLVGANNDTSVPAAGSYFRMDDFVLEVS